ncbi:MAG TPA: sigma factor, partial [Ktedonobacterales bacterium]
RAFGHAVESCAKANSITLAGIVVLAAMSGERWQARTLPGEAKRYGGRCGGHAPLPAGRHRGAGGTGRAVQVTAVRVAFLLVQDRALAEDIVQDSFLLAYRASGRFRLGAPFAPWFYQIVLNAARQQQRAIGVCRSTSRWSGRVARWCCRCSFSRR